MLSAVTATTPTGSTQSGAFTLPILAAASEPVSAAIWNSAAALACVDTTPDRIGFTCLVLDRRGPMDLCRIESGQHTLALMQRAISHEFTDWQIKIC